MHSYVIGATRSGKTNYLLSHAEGAFAFIDTHVFGYLEIGTGDAEASVLFARVLAAASRHRRQNPPRNPTSASRLQLPAVPSYENVETRKPNRHGLSLPRRTPASRRRKSARCKTRSPRSQIRCRCATCLGSIPPPSALQKSSRRARPSSWTSQTSGTNLPPFSAPSSSTNSSKPPSADFSGYWQRHRDQTDQ